MVGSLCVNLCLFDITMICAKTVVPIGMLFRLWLTGTQVGSRNRLMLLFVKILQAITVVYGTVTVGQKFNQKRFNMMCHES